MKKHKHEYLLISEKNTLIQKRTFVQFLSRLKKKIKIEYNIHSYRFRKNVTTRLLNNGCLVTTIQKLLGHANIRITMKYLDLHI